MSSSREISHRKPKSKADRLRTLSLGTAAFGSVALPALTADATAGSQPHRASAEAHPETPAAAVGRAVDQGVRQGGDEGTEVDDSYQHAARAGGPTTPRPQPGPQPGPQPKQAPRTAPEVKRDPAVVQYRVEQGDTLYGIAARLLDDGDRYPEIFAANRDRGESDGGRFTDPNLIKPGWTLDVAVGAPDPRPAADRQPEHTASATVKVTTKQAVILGAPVRTKPEATGSLDTWITDARTILASHGYQVSYQAIYETAMHESGGDPTAVNHWDSNAAAGHPSMGLMQTIGPTFDAYALDGHRDVLNPVDNIIAAVRYAVDRYGSLDEVVAARCGGSCWHGY